jgi:hypothetical protein
MQGLTPEAYAAFAQGIFGAFNQMPTSRRG